MEEPDSHVMQQTPPPSPYLETTWDLALDEVHHRLLHPTEKRVGYLELYFAGFMEFADAPPSPAMSDDETEYPRWGRVAATHDKPPPSTATAGTPPSIDSSSFSDTADPVIHPLSHRTATASTDNTDYSGYESSLRDLPPSTLSESISPRRMQRHKRDSRRCGSAGNGRITKAYRQSCSTIRTRSMAINGQARLRSHAIPVARKYRNSKGR